MIQTFHLRRICLVAAMLWTIFIWGNSLQTAVESSQTSQGVLSTLMPFLTWCGLSEDVLHTLVRKAAHMTEFALLGLLWSVALRKSEAALERVGWVLLICVLTALTDESIQLFVPGRSGELRDVWIDFLGGILGVILVPIFILLIENIKKQPKEKAP